MGALSEMRMLTQKSETHCCGLDYGKALSVIDTFIIGDHKSVQENVR